MYSRLPHELSFPLSAQVRHLNAGAEVLNKSVTFSNKQWSYEFTDHLGAGQSYDCAATLEATGDHNLFIYICTGREFTPTTLSPSTTIQQARNAGDVTFHSAGYHRWWYRDMGSEGYTWNFGWSFSEGTRVPLLAATSYTMQTTLTAGERAFKAELVVPLEDLGTRWDIDNPYTCRDFLGADYSGTRCFSNAHTYRGVFGYASNRPAS